MIVVIFNTFAKNILCTRRDMFGLFILIIMYQEYGVPDILAVTLIMKTSQAPVIQFIHLEPGSKRDQIWDNCDDKEL